MKKRKKETKKRAKGGGRKKLPPDEVKLSKSIRVSTKDFKIVDIMPISPSGTNVYFKVICRG